MNIDQIGNESYRPRNSNITHCSSEVLLTQMVNNNKPLPNCNNGNLCSWEPESSKNNWRETCRYCGVQAQGSGQ
jgi:hypothetical protein